MKTIHFSLLWLIATVAIAQGQNSTWEIKIEEEVLYATGSKDGIHALYIYEDDNDSINAVCIDAVNGMMLWKRTLVDFEEYSICRFINNDTVMLGQKQQYEFINAESGKLLKTLPIIGESWSNIKRIYTPPARSHSAIGLRRPSTVGDIWPVGGVTFGRRLARRIGMESAAGAGWPISR